MRRSAYTSLVILCRRCTGVCDHGFTAAGMARLLHAYLEAPDAKHGGLAWASVPTALVDPAVPYRRLQRSYKRRGMRSCPPSSQPAAAGPSRSIYKKPYDSHQPWGSCG